MEGSIEFLEVVDSSNYENHDDYDHDHHNNKMTTKHKRTRHGHMPSSPASLTTSSASSSGPNCSFSSPTSPSSGELTEEEEDMANCLILLAQGHHHHDKLMIKYANINVYECKTCNRTFPSFQALGGHRASHKKPKSDDKKSPVSLTTAPLLSKKSSEQDHQQHRHRDQDQDHHHGYHHMPVFVNKNNTSGNKSLGTSTKVHECSICGAEFTSGQALGGHMRRHRAAVPPPVPSPNIISAAAAPNLLPSSSSLLHGDDVNGAKRRSNNILPLDLNLPAPAEDDIHKSNNSESKFGFVISAVPALVDCHY